MPINSHLNTDLILLNEENTEAHNLAVTAAKVALNNFEWRYITMVLHNSSILLGLRAFMQVYQKSVIVGNRFLDFEESTREIIQFVVFGSDLNNIMYVLDWMRNKQFDNTGKFIVICKNCDEREAMDIFWNHKITNVVFINDGSGASNLIGFTYSVYDNEKCEISLPHPLQETCIQNSCTKVFHMKLTNFHRCPIIVSTIVQVPLMSLELGIPRGADGDLLRLIAKSINATLKVMTPHWGSGFGQLNKNGYWSGSLADVYYDLANFSMTSSCITLTRRRDFHMSTNYYSINIVWVTHPSMALPAWQKLLRPFQIIARISLVVTFLFVIMAAVFLKSKYWTKISKRIITSAQPHKCFLFNAWAIFMGMPRTIMPSKPAFSTIFLLWVYYCFMIRTFYQTSLIRAMKNNYNSPEFENLEDILSSGYPFGGVPSLKEFFNDVPEVYYNWKPINSTDIFKTMVSLSKGMKYVLAVKKVTAKNFLTKHYGNLHIVPETIVTSPTVLFFKKFSPMVESVNRVLERLTEGGFTDKFYKDHANIQTMKKIESSAAINVGHYAGCYVVLAAGWIVSVIVFLCEISYKCSKQ
ncbi:uncharacterized protein LOC133520624 [Cydia pomonella]|uniref:uncharacterized protein LOC133520624 n=1 Tax=Cydia pomonella TaxID=82600 RepID=UPI002ADE24C3|nr:uncharacterized protein LOC133520624 [Cydia pomonella]